MKSEIHVCEIRKCDLINQQTRFADHLNHSGCLSLYNASKNHLEKSSLFTPFSFNKISAQLRIFFLSFFPPSSTIIIYIDLGVS